MKKILRDIFLQVAGCLLFSIYIPMFLVPNHIGTGGLAGISLGLNKLFNTPIGLSTFILNVPLFIFGYNLLGKKFAFKSAIIVFISSFLIDFFGSHIDFRPLDNVLTATIFAGVASGLAMAFLFMSGSSTGGLDISGKIVKHRFPSLQLSKILLTQDILVYIFLACTLGIHSVMYAIIMSFIRSKTIEAVQEWVASSKQCVIISQKPEPIIKAITTELGRGVTLLNAEGCYSHTDRKFIYVVIQKVQLNTLKSIVNEIDPHSFVTVSSVNYIQGNFKQKSLSI